MSDFCAAMVRRHDRDRFVLSLRAPAAARAGLWALYAFNYEVARTRETVTDAPLGRIRLQWWREAVNEALRADNPQFHHEILRHLRPVMMGRDAAPLYALIDAREADMGGDIGAGLDGLTAYAVATNAPLLQLGAQICGQAIDDASLRNVAGAYGLVGLLRAHMWHGGGDGGLRGADTDSVAARARDMLAAAGKPRGLAGAQAALAGLYLRRLQRHGPEAPPFLLLRLIFSGR